jgi:hypothetical protein
VANLPSLSKTRLFSHPYQKYDSLSSLPENTTSSHPRQKYDFCPKDQLVKAGNSPPSLSEKGKRTCAKMTKQKWLRL